MTKQDDIELLQEYLQDIDAEGMRLMRQPEMEAFVSLVLAIAQDIEY